MTEVNIFDAAGRTTLLLKPCPFCGDNAELDVADGDFTIGCGGATCPVYVVAGPYDTVAKAAEVWNERAGGTS